MGEIPTSVQAPPVRASGRPSGLLERSRELSRLEESLASVVNGSGGRLVLVRGEAGVGKTALLRAFCDEHRQSARILWGASDALFTPRPLGPLLDIAGTLGGELAALVASAARPHEVAAALLGELSGRATTIVVLEDVHWADEATLDVLRLLARRVEAVRALVLVSYRDDELDRTHPLRIVLGELTTGLAVARIELAPLSAAAVEELAGPHGLNGEELHRKTAGNPFFVTEVLAAADEEIPHTVRDAVLARAARLSPAAMTVLEAVAVVPPQAELWLLRALAPEASEHLGECLTSGMLTHGEGGVAFRHELARLAVEDSLAPDRRFELNRRALAALATQETSAPDLARLAHHAEAAGDAEAVLRYAPAAAERAASLGAHREAAAQYSRALRFAEELPHEAMAEVLRRYAYECFLIDQYDDAIEALRRARDCHRQLGDLRAEGDALSSLSQFLWCPGRVSEAEQAAREAVALLERLPPGRELARAYSHLSMLCLNTEDAEGAFAWGTHAIGLAERLDESEIIVHALNTIGTMEFLGGIPEGREKLERSLALAREAGLEEHVGRAYLNLAWAASRLRAYDIANPYLDIALEYCNERGLDLHLFYIRAYRARTELDQGRWTEALDLAEHVLRRPRTSLVPRIVALVVLGLVRARRGDSEVWPPLDEAFALAQPAAELQRIAPVAAARAEAAWLEGKQDAVADATERVFEVALRRGAPWPIGELAYWRWRAGIREEIPPAAAEPYSMQMAGDWARAAELWAELGVPYEAALALSDADDDNALRRALDELHRLGARPAAAIVARRLRERGARGVPRGPRPETRQNPANLTPRELEVLVLLAQGLHNAEIAEHLFLSEKTVDHHVSAILRKLGVRSRGQASTEAVRLGLAGQDR